MHDVVVVGAGTAGCYTSYLLAQKGLDVALLEKEPGFKDRIVCTGIVSREAYEKFTLPSEAVIREINSFKVFASSGVHFHYKHAEPFANVINREYLQKWLYRKMLDAGVKLLPGCQVHGLEHGPETVRVQYRSGRREESLFAKLLVIATGIDLPLLEKAGLACSPDFLQGVQLEAEVTGIDEIEVYLGEEIAPKSFAWVVPLGNGVAKIGLTTKRQSTTHLIHLLKNSLLKGRFRKQLTKAGFRFVPYGMAVKSVNDRILAVGDAAGQVKTTTGGGVYYGLLCSEIAADTIMQGFSENDLSAKMLKKYEKRWQKTLKSEIEAGIFIRRLFSGFNDQKINMAISLANTDGIKPLIMKKANFDWQKPFLTSLVKRPILQRLF